MKRMNEVFELPLVVEFVGGNEFHVKNEARHIPAIISNSFDESYSAARAINHVDKLADALDESLAMLFMANNLHCGTGIDDPVIAKLRAVLDDYRGEK